MRWQFTEYQRRCNRCMESSLSDHKLCRTEWSCDTNMIICTGAYVDMYIDTYTYADRNVTF